MPLLDQNMSELQWPKAGQVVFDQDGDWWKLACLDYTHVSTRFGFYTEGYKVAADIAVENAISTRSSMDMLVFPIAFLYRHFLELALKETIGIARKYLGIAGSFPTNHNLHNLWHVCRPLLEEAFSSSPPEDLDNVQSIILQYATKDPLSTLFRYPVDKDGRASRIDSARLNLENLKEVMDGLYSFFIGVQSAMEEGISAQMENMDYPY